MTLDDSSLIPLRIQFPRLLQWYSIRIIFTLGQELLLFIGQESTAVRHEVCDLIERLYVRVDILESCDPLSGLSLSARESEALTVALELRLVWILMSHSPVPYTAGQLLLHLIENRIDIIEHRVRWLKQKIDVYAGSWVHDNLRLRESQRHLSGRIRLIQ